MTGALSTVAVLLALAGFIRASSNLDPQYGWCTDNLTSINANVSLQNLIGDWLMVYSTDIATRKGASVWGGELPYDYCDVMNLNKGCMDVGLTITDVKDTKQFGYTYAFNAFTETWTLTQFQASVYTLGDRSSVGYRINYLHYVQIPDKDLFVNNKATACGSSKVIRSGPIYRSSNFVVLAADPDIKWLALLYCDAFYGFFLDYPLIQIIVKKEYMDQISYPLSTCPFYLNIRENVKKAGFNIYAGDFNLVFHDDNGYYPTSVSWDSIQWEADCLCKN